MKPLPQRGCMTPARYFTAKIKCICSWVYVFAIVLLLREGSPYRGELSVTFGYKKEASTRQDFKAVQNNVSMQEQKSLYALSKITPPTDYYTYKFFRRLISHI